MLEGTRLGRMLKKGTVYDTSRPQACKKCGQLILMFRNGKPVHKCKKEIK